MRWYQIWFFLKKKYYFNIFISEQHFEKIEGLIEWIKRIQELIY
jgi:hypothetical protein